MEVSSIRHSLTAESGNQNKPNLFHRIFPCITAASNASLATPAEDFHENIYENIDIYEGKSSEPFVNKTNSRQTIVESGLHCLINMIYEIKNFVNPFGSSISKLSATTFYFNFNEYGETSKNGNVITGDQDSPPQLPSGARAGIIIRDEYATVNDTLDQPIYAEPVGPQVIDEALYEEITFNNNGSAQGVSDTPSKVNKGAESKSEISAEKEPIESFLYPKNSVDNKLNKPFMDSNGSVNSIAEKSIDEGPNKEEFIDEASLDIEAILSRNNIYTTEL